MNKFLNYILKGRGRGFLPLLTGSILLSIIISLFFHANIDTLLPLTAADLQPIVPITFENGVIVEPADQLKKVTVKRDNIEYVLALDTRADEIDKSELDKTGLYLSRRYFYVVDGQDVRRQSFDNINVVVDEDGLKQAFEKIRFYMVAGVFIFMALGLFVLFVLMMFALLLTLLFSSAAQSLSLAARMRLNSMVVLWTALVAFGFLFAPLVVPTWAYFILAVLIQHTLISALCQRADRLPENKD